MTARPDFPSSSPPVTRSAATPAVASVLDDTNGFVWLPQSLGGLFDTAFELYKRHFLSLAAIAAVVLIPAQLLAYALLNLWVQPLTLQFGADTNDAGTLLRLIVGWLLIGVPGSGVPGVLELLALALVSAPLSVALGELAMGRAVILSHAYRRALPALPLVLLAWIIGGLAFLGVWMMGAVGCLIGVSVLISILGAVASEGVSIAAFLILLLVPYIFAMAVVAYTYVFSAPILTLERAGLSQMYLRHRQLVSAKKFRRVWGAAVCLPLITYGLQFLILYSLESLLASASQLVTISPLIQNGLGILSAALVGLFFETYLLVFLVVLYQDCRIRREGLDVRALLNALPSDVGEAA